MAVIYAVGVGPGDPELLTRKAERVLRTADVIVAPVSDPAGQSVALETIREFLDGGRQEILVRQFPMTSDRDRLAAAWRETAGIMAERALLGKAVAFVTIGDPLFYSTFIYLLRIFRTDYPEIPVDIIPGISSINASASLAAIPLAEAEEAMAVIPATVGAERIAAALARFETVVLIKIKPRFADVLQILRQSGRDRSTVLVERAGSARQQVLSEFAAIEAHTPDYLSLLIVKRPADS